MIRNKFTLLVFVLFLSLISCKTQNVEDSFTYEVRYEKFRNIDKEIFDQRHQNENLETRLFNWENLNRKEYYTLWFEGNESLYKKEIGLKNESELKTSSGTVSYKENETMLYRDIHKPFTLLSIDNENLIIKDSLQKIHWDLNHSETKKILDFTVRKATAKGLEKGSLITAWYTEAIPNKHGPFVYWGLPGLILEVEKRYEENDDSNALNEIIGSTIIALEVKKSKSKDIEIRTKNKRILTSDEWQKEIEMNNKKLREFSNQGVDLSE